MLNYGDYLLRHSLFGMLLKMVYCFLSLDLLFLTHILLLLMSLNFHLLNLVLVVGLCQ
ncbi:hypothetical protein LINPERPRIM_LOCUS17112, partial [Linum perenne]